MERDAVETFVFFLVQKATLRYTISFKKKYMDMGCKEEKKTEGPPASSSRPFTGKISKIHLFQRIINTFLI